MRQLGKHVKLQVNRYEHIEVRNYWRAQCDKAPPPKLDNDGQVKRMVDHFEKIIHPKTRS